ncbi:MAG: hypothetical protein AB1813_01915 [Verrucomicrobiota bacterium]
MKKLRFHNGLYFAVGDNQSILSSEDGVSWSQVKSGEAGRYYDVLYAAGLYVAVGSDHRFTPARALVSVSKNLRDWTSYDMQTEGELYGIAYGQGKFTAVGGTEVWDPSLGYIAAPLIVTSNDGGEWARVLIPDVPTVLKAVAFGAGTFVAVGGHRIDSFESQGEIITSRDALSWTPAVVKPNSQMTDVVFANGRFTVIGGAISWSLEFLGWPRNDNFVIYDSLNGDEWITVSQGTQGKLYKLAVIGETYWAFGEYNANLPGPVNEKPFVASSIGGVVWRLTKPSSLTPVDATFGEQGFIGRSSTGQITKSTDGVTWTGLDQSPSLQIQAVARGAGKWVVVGKGGGIAFSTEGEKWATVGSPVSSDLADVAFGQRFVAVGAKQVAVFSDDGQTWRKSNLGESSAVTLKAVAYGAGMYVAVGERNIPEGSPEGLVLSSSDGLEWRTRAVTQYWLEDVTYAAGAFVAVGGFEAILRSPDGVRWTMLNRGDVDDYNGIVWGGNMFIINGLQTLLWSSDSQNWERIQPNLRLRKVLGFAGGRFFGVTQDSKLVYSRNATNWVAVEFSYPIPAAVFDAVDSVLAVGSNGLIVMGHTAALPRVLQTKRQNDGSFVTQFEVAGWGTTNLEASSDLRQWITLRSESGVSLVEYTDRRGLATQFYRLRCDE